MKTEYTKGPWVYYKLNDQSGFEISQKEELTGLPTRSAIVPYVDNEGEANARLIAAAPELLEAGEQLIEAMNQKDFFMEGYANGSASISEVREFSAREHEAYSKLFDVIKKAKGL